jgi:hypothetical protein
MNSLNEKISNSLAIAMAVALWKQE